MTFLVLNVCKMLLFSLLVYYGDRLLWEHVDETWRMRSLQAEMVNHYIYLLLTDLWWEYHCCIWANTDRKQCVWGPVLLMKRTNIEEKANVGWAHQVEESGQCALVSASSDRRLCALGTLRRGLEKDALWARMETWNLGLKPCLLLCHLRNL